MAEQIYDRLQEISPDETGVRLERASDMADKTGDITALRSAVAALAPSTADDRNGLTWRLFVAENDRNWAQAKEIIEKMKGGEDLGLFAMGWWPVPVGCHSILIARLQGDLAGANSSFAAVREQMNQKMMLYEVRVPWSIWPLSTLGPTSWIWPLQHWIQ